MKNRLLLLFLGTLLLTGACSVKDASSASRQSAPANYTIEVGGSTSVTPLMELFAEEYCALKPHIKININGTGSSDGIKNAGTLYQIGMSSRELTPAEQGAGLKEEVAAIDGIAVIVNKNNPVNSLSIEQIRDIYTGAVTDWSQVSAGSKSGKIAVISREEGSGTRGAFEELAGFQGKLLAGANESTSTGAIKAGIVQNADAIGYISLGSADETVKALAVNGVSPSGANVKNGTYKIARPFIVLTGNNVHAESAAFISWMLTDEGQKIAAKNWISIK